MRILSIVLAVGLFSCAQDAVPYSDTSDVGADAVQDGGRDVPRDQGHGDTPDAALDAEDAQEDAVDVALDPGVDATDTAPDDVPADAPETCTDEDGDGRPGSGICDLDDPNFDCNDDNPAVYPGADEVCDDLDNDCDGDADEGLTVNVCGGCGALAGAPDQPCGDCGIYACSGPNSLVCERPECDVHILSDNQRTWQHRAVDRDGRGAPDSPVLAAFNVRELDIAYVLTADTWHLLDLTDLTWAGSGSLRQLMPEVTGLVQGAYAVPSDHANGDRVNSGVFVLAGGVAHVYFFNIQTRGFSHRMSVVPEWPGEFAPQRTRIRSWWIDVTHSEGWYSADPSEHCETPAEAEFTVVISALARDVVHAYDGGYCQLWIESFPQRFFTPFQAPGAPNPDSINATFFHGSAFYVWTH